MSDHIDDLARTVAERTTRRKAAATLGALALGVLSSVSLGQRTEASNNDCQKCKKQCRRSNKKPGKKEQTNCSKKCNDKCKRN